MAAATKNRQYASTGVIRKRKIKVAASTKIYQGTLVCWNLTGFAVPAAKTTGFLVAGVALEEVDNSAGADGAKTIEVGVGIFKFPDLTDVLAQADVGRLAYVLDDQNLCSAANGSQVVAGQVEHLDDDGDVWISVGLESTLQSLITAIETVTSGAMSVRTRTTLMSTTGAQAYTLAAGLFEGQRKTIIQKVNGGGTDVGTITLTTPGGTTLAFNAVNEAVELEYHDASGWNVVLNIGGVVLD